MSIVSEVSTAAPRRKFGTLSVVLAAVAFALRTILLGIYVSVPADISGGAKDAVGWFFVLTLLVFVPILEISGIVLGIASLFRTGDRKALGILGAVFNACLLVGGVLFAIILIAYIGHPY